MHTPAIAINNIRLKKSCSLFFAIANVSAHPPNTVSDHSVRIVRSSTLCCCCEGVPCIVGSAWYLTISPKNRIFLAWFPSRSDCIQLLNVATVALALIIHLRRRIVLLDRVSVAVARQTAAIIKKARIPFIPPYRARRRSGAIKSPDSAEIVDMLAVYKIHIFY